MPGLPATGIRHYLGNETADMLGVPKADWTRVIFEIMQRTDQLYRVRPGSSARDRAHRLAPGPAYLAGLRALRAGGGKRPAFQVTDELKDAWGMKSR